MHQTLDRAENRRLHAGRLSLASEILADHDLRLGLEYIGPKAFWSTERHPFVHDITDARALIAETDASTIGLFLDSRRADVRVGTPVRTLRPGSWGRERAVRANTWSARLISRTTGRRVQPCATSRSSARSTADRRPRHVRQSRSHRRRGSGALPRHQHHW